MAEDVSENMVLRTIYLPRYLDQQLKTAAFRDERSKNDIIRELIQAGIEAKLQGGDPRFGAQMVQLGSRPATVVRPERRTLPIAVSVESRAKAPEASKTVGRTRKRTP